MTLARHLVGMTPKSKRNDGDVPQAWWYRGADSVTLYQRIGGRDVKVGRYEISKFTNGAATATMREARHAARVAINDAAPSAPGRGRPAKQLASQATWADVWAHFRAEARRNNKWVESTANNNDQRVERHLAGRPKGHPLGALPAHPLWSTPMRLTAGSDVYALLAPLRADKPGEEECLRNMLNLMVATAWAMKVLPEDSDPVRQAMRQMATFGKKGKRGKLAACTHVPTLREFLRRIDASKATLETRTAYRLQAYTGHRSERVREARLEHFHAPKKAGEPWRWITPRALMKGRDNAGKPWPHELIVPPKMLALLQRLPSWKHQAKGGWLFPGRIEGKPLANLDNGMRELLGKGVHTPHGWRSAIKTNAIAEAQRDRPLFNQWWIDAVTDHKPRGIDAHYVREAAVQGGGRVLAWWVDQLTSRAT